MNRQIPHLHTALLRGREDNKTGWLTFFKDEVIIFFRSILIKLTQWEFWPTPLLYLPAFVYYAWLSLRSRSFFFFTMTNPGMEMGGLYNTSKYRQLNSLPDCIKSKTIFVKKGTTVNEVEEMLSFYKIRYPFIVKPDRLERGAGVKLVKDYRELASYLATAEVDVLVQEYVDFPFEAGVFFYKIPGEHTGSIPSIVIKEFLSVTGDGLSTVKELLLKNKRALLVWENMKTYHHQEFDTVLKENEVKVLEPIGNHNRGTKFINGNCLVSARLEAMFTNISSQLPGFYYGRFDLKAPGLEAFLKGQHIKILEVNGVNAEPAHIYDPSTNLFEGISSILRHWHIIFKISKQNRKNGYLPVKLKEAVSHYKQWKNAAERRLPAAS